MVTLRLCAVVMLLDAAVTLTAGVVGFGVVPPLPPPLHALTHEMIAIKRKKRGNFANRIIQKPFHTTSELLNLDIEGDDHLNLLHPNIAVTAAAHCSGPNCLLLVEPCANLEVV